MKRLFSCRNGVSLIEFAFALPLLILFLLGAMELARYIVLNIKLDKAAAAMADLVTQREEICNPDMDDFAIVLPRILTPFEFNGSAIFSSVAFFPTPTAPCTGANAACISWQYQAIGSDASRIGASGGNATLPGGYTVLEGQNVIVSEVTLNYSPMLDITSTFISSLTPHQLYKASVYKPRQGTLTELCPPPAP